MHTIKQIYHIAASCALLLGSHMLQARPLLMLTLRPLLETDLKKTHQKLMNTLKKPGGLTRCTVKNGLTRGGVGGVFATYAGYMTVSQPDGQLVFPLHHSEPRVSLLIAPSIKPVMSRNLTIDHWRTRNINKAAFFIVERKKDPLSQELFWEAHQESIPADYDIPLESMVIFAKPKNVIVPSGPISCIPITSQSPHFILPDILIKKGEDLAGNALSVLTISQFFKPVRFARQDPDKKRVILQFDQQEKSGRTIED